jgi:hypothetical protein
MSNEKLDRLIALTQELANALIEIRDIPLPPTLIADSEAYLYASRVRERTLRGLQHLINAGNGI